MATSKAEKLAVLIDADNAQPSIAAQLLAEVSRHGTALVKRAYGDWTTPQLRSWKDVLHALAIQPVQQFSYTTGKNATDSAMIIDAMDLLHAGHLDGFCLVSSDSDFTRLATRLREAGLKVYGFGERKTPKPFVAACDRFVYTEILRDDTHDDDDNAEPAPAIEPLEPQLVNAIKAMTREDGWAPLSSVGSFLMKNNPSFDARNYKFSKLGELVRHQPYLEVKEESLGEGTAHLHVRLRRAEVATPSAKPRAARGPSASSDVAKPKAQPATASAKPAKPKTP